LPTAPPAPTPLTLAPPAPTPTLASPEFVEPPDPDLARTSRMSSSVRAPQDSRYAGHTDTAASQCSGRTQPSYQQVEPPSAPLRGAAMRRRAWVAGTLCQLGL